MLHCSQTQNFLGCWPIFLFELSYGRIELSLGGRPKKRMLYAAQHGGHGLDRGIWIRQERYNRRRHEAMRTGQWALAGRRYSRLSARERCLAGTRFRGDGTRPVQRRRVSTVLAGLLNQPTRLRLVCGSELEMYDVLQSPKGTRESRSHKDFFKIT